MENICIGFNDFIVPMNDFDFHVIILNLPSVLLPALGRPKTAIYFCIFKNDSLLRDWFNFSSHFR